jgi:hypothetical protein
LEENFDRFQFALHKEKEMADFRRWIIVLACLALFAGLASAQVGGGGGTALSCGVNTANTPALRSEGITELAGDIVITCTGGAPSNGTTVPVANITIALTTQVTSRLITVGGTTASEALLLIDEPGTGAGVIAGYGPGEPLTPCTSPASGCGAYTETIIAGPTPGGPNPTGPYSTSTGGTVTAANGASANVYYGVVSGNQVTFFGIPVNPPGTNGSRVFRITNLRANASGINGGTGAVPLQASIITSNFAALPISNATPIVGFVEPSLSTSVGTSTGYAQCVGVALTSGNTIANTVTFAEAGTFASAFKTRTDPTVPGQTATPGPTTGQGSAAVQNKPGTIYNSESGFTLSSSSIVGFADYGTRFQAVVNNIPAGAHVYASLWNVTSSTSNGVTTYTQATPTSVAAAEMVTSPTAAEGSYATSTGTSNGVSVVEVTPASGSSATVAWEVITTQPNALDKYQFVIFVTYTASPGTNSPALGTATVNAGYAPTSTVTSASSSATEPRFIDTSKATNLFSVATCRTVLLFPFVTNQLGFDTGLAISNTSSDPFGTSPQTGTCSLNWYGAAAPAVTTLGNGGATGTSAPVIAAGTTSAVLASVVAPGFQGYMIATCNFQFGHGFAFISDVGARNLAMGYLADVIPDPATQGGIRLPAPPNPGNTNSGEQLAQ